MQPLKMPDGRAIKVGVIGLGYVGLPLAAAMGQRFETVGFDLDAGRIAQLQDGIDRTGELDNPHAPMLTFTADDDGIADCTVYIVAVPTPIDREHLPDLEPLITASVIVGRVLKRGDIVVYESTVYPGATEEDCIPVVESVSGLTYNREFFAGYSPERINPGDKQRPLGKIVKITSGSTPEVAEFVDRLYGTIIEAGTFRAASIKVAEAAKIIENTQRDVNIALINELSIVFSHLGIDTVEVIEAAQTKWNFMRVTPGLVGGHCIGVDPYYLLHRSERAGYIPDVIRTARIINNGMAKNAAARLLKLMSIRGMTIPEARVLILGATFKENCGDVRDSKVIDLARELLDWRTIVDIHDPNAPADLFQGSYGMALQPQLQPPYAAVILAVPHAEFIDWGPERMRSLLAPDGVFFDLKAAFPKSASDLRL